MLLHSALSAIATKESSSRRSSVAESQEEGEEDKRRRDGCNVRQLGTGTLLASGLKLQTPPRASERSDKLFAEEKDISLESTSKAEAPQVEKLQGSVSPPGPVGLFLET